MIPRISKIAALDDYKLSVDFDDGKSILYDVGEDIETIPAFADLRTIPALFQQVQLDQSRTCVFWNETLDLPSDTIYECGKMTNFPIEFAGE